MPLGELGTSLSAFGGVAKLCRSGGGQWWLSLAAVVAGVSPDSVSVRVQRPT